MDLEFYGYLNLVPLKFLRISIEKSKNSSSTKCDTAEWSTSNSINVKLSVPFSTQLINRHTDGEIEIHEICQFHVNGFRVTLNERKRRNGKHSREFNANSHVVGKTNMRCDTFCHVPPRYWLSISGKIVRASSQQKLSHFCVLFWRVWKIDYVTKKSFLSILFVCCFPFFLVLPSSLFTFRELQSFSIPQTSLNYRKIYYVRKWKGNTTKTWQKTFLGI